MREKVKAVLDNMYNKCYVIKGNARSLTCYFALLERATEKQIVYDVTKSGLNSAQ
jgi:hypothetical protein